MNIGARVRFKAHGETGLVCTIITRDGDDVTLQDPQGRLLMRTPIELLVFADPADGDKAWREVDELEIPSRWAVWCEGCTNVRESKTIGLVGRHECPKCGKMNLQAEGVTQPFRGVFPSEAPNADEITVVT